MVTAIQILKGAGIKNAKTLTRWHQQGIIPGPKIKTSPSGRGKIGYWPDWVLGKCARIRELQNDGVPLKQAAQAADRERLLQDMKLLGETQVVERSGVSVSIGTRASYDSLLGVLILDCIRKSFTDETLVSGIADRLKSVPIRKSCNDALERGGVPVLFGDASDLTITPDFQVNLLLRLKASEGRCFIVLPLLQAIRDLDKALGNEPTPDPDALLQRRFRPTDDMPGQVSSLGDLSLDELLGRIQTITRREKDTD